MRLPTQINTNSPSFTTAWASWTFRNSPTRRRRTLSWPASGNPANFDFMKPLSLPVWCLAGAAVLLAGCGTLPESNSKNHVVTQASTYDALYHGLYDGEAPLRQLAPLGNLGLGTVDHFDGEVVLLDGKFHVIRSDGHVDSITDLNTTSPFLEVESF